MCNEDRLMTIMKALNKTTNLDVLSQTAAIVYNLLAIDECKTIMLKRGIIDFIFEVAKCGVESVRHICSACLHMAPDNMPDLENPEVLSLVMCLLDADGDLFGDMAVRAVEQLEYILGSTAIASAYVHEGTDFSGHWITLVCDVDSNFSPGSVDALTTDGVAKIPTRAMAAASMGMQSHQIMGADVFNEFTTITTHSKEDYNSQSGEDSEMRVNDGMDRFDDLTVNTPEPRAPSGSSDPYAQQQKRNEADMNKSITSSKYNEAFDDTSTLGGGGGLGEGSVVSMEIVEGGGGGDAGFETVNRPLLPKDVTFPNLTKPGVPEDTLGAIKGSLYKHVKSFPIR